MTTMTEQQRILELVLLQVGMEGPRSVRIGPVIASGAHLYRHVTVDGHRPLMCKKVVADLLQHWMEEHAGVLTFSPPFNYQLSHLREDGLDLIVEISPVWPLPPE
jgi:hypothetical protein